MRTILGVFIALAGIVLFSGDAGAQNADGFKRCGASDIVLVFMNPDLGVRDDGFVHASGSFFIQFQARGEDALKIETLKFSMGKPADVGLCDAPEWVTGAYIKNLRADYEWEDGFFIPINTCNVPDGEYAAALSAYDAEERELVRYWTVARVENGEGTTKDERCANPDTTKPWPMILPGDGVRLDGGYGLYVEVGEPVESVEAFVNGVKVQLTPGEGPLRDDDMVPDLGYNPTLRESPVAQNQVQARRYPIFTWTGDLNPGSVVKVVAKDVSGNVAEKVVHLGDPTIGGRVTLAKPDFELRLPVTDLTADANGTATYNVTYVTKNEEGLHADLYVRGAAGAELPKGVTYRLSPNHVMMGGNRELAGEVTLIALPDVELGTYTVEFLVSWLSGDRREEKTTPLTFRVTSVPQSDYTKDEQVADEDARIANEQVAPVLASEPEPTVDAPPAETPVPAWVVVAAVGFAGVAARRRLTR